MPVLIPENYVADLDVRLGLYRRLGGLATEQEIDAFAAELIDRFGPLPAEVENLLQVVAIKQLCRSSGVERLEIGPEGRRHRVPGQPLRPARTSWWSSSPSAQSIVTLRPDHRLVYRQDWADTKARLARRQEADAESGGDGGVTRAPNSECRNQSSQTERFSNLRS